VKAGTYTLYAIPGKTAILSLSTKTWMFGDLTFIRKQDVARLSVPGNYSCGFSWSIINGFTASDSGVVLNMGWDKVR
jgi:hypothetical protein